MKGLALFAIAIVLLQHVCSIDVSRDELSALVRRVESLENTVGTLKEENRELKRSSAAQDQRRTSRFVLDSMESPIAFTAAIQPVYVGHMNPKQTIVFETTITDIGGGYNNATGVFIAPRAGIYVFSCSLMDHTDATAGGLMVHAEIVKKNHTVLGRVFAHAEESKYRDQGAQTVTTHLDAGDQVWVRIYDSRELSLGGELYSTFTGFLLYGSDHANMIVG